MKKLFSLFLIISITAHTQNVGIGTTSPSEKLEVTGNVKADGGKFNALKLSANPGNGKILTSDVDGNASWQNNLISNSNGYGVWGDCATMANVSEYSPVADANSVADSYFGKSVAISGNFAIIGAERDKVGANFSQGSASIYEFDGTNWVFMQKLTDPGGATGDYFGSSVCISGNYAVVGAPFDDGVNLNQGSASIFYYNGSSWIYQQKLFGGSGALNDDFGTTVSISGSYVSVGCYADDLGGASNNQGSVSVFKFNGASWTLMQKITDATGAPSDWFGNSVSICGNLLLVGEYGDDVGANLDQGSALIYMFNGVSWTFVQKISDPSGNSNDAFGISVSLSPNDAVIGAFNDNVNSIAWAGSAHVFHYSGGAWSYVQKLTDVIPEVTAYFGNSVSISGNYILVGAWQDDINGNDNQGSIHIFRKLGIGWQRIQKLTDPGFNGHDEFGCSVAIDGTSQRFLVGASNCLNNSGKVIFGKLN